jgi:hypothetical protein
VVRSPKAAPEAVGDRLRRTSDRLWRYDRHGQHASGVANVVGKEGLLRGAFPACAAPTPPMPAPLAPLRPLPTRPRPGGTHLHVCPSRSGSPLRYLVPAVPPRRNRQGAPPIGVVQLIGYKVLLLYGHKEALLKPNRQVPKEEPLARTSMFPRVEAARH